MSRQSEASISVADTFFITGGDALWTGAGNRRHRHRFPCALLRKRHAPVRVGFNVAAPALSLWVAAHAFFLLAGIPPLAVGRISMPPIGPLLALAGIYFLLNSSLIAVAVGIRVEEAAAAGLARALPVAWRQVPCRGVDRVLRDIHHAAGRLSRGGGRDPGGVITFHLTLRASFGRLDDARRHVTQVDRLYTSTIETLAMAIDAKDDVTHNHVRRVQAYALRWPRLGVSDEQTLKAIEAAALLHDTGKLAVPERILNKPGKLTAAEFEQMKLHVDVGADILSLVDFPYPVVPIVRCHHENWDGSGYPAGVAGEATIPIGARILSVVDCFDALTSDRPYRKRLTDEDAIAILVERRGRMCRPARRRYVRQNPSRRRR